MREATNREILDTPLTKGDVQKLYARLAPMYDAWANLTEVRARQACLERAGIVDGQAVLEVAVGTGLMFAEILARNPGGRNVGIDLTEQMLQRARDRAARRAPRAQFELKVGDAYALEFPADTFDRVVNNYMFDLLPERDFGRVLAEFLRVLRPGGRLALVNMTKGAHWYQDLPERVFRLSPRLMGGCRGVLLEPFVRDAGFVRVERALVTQLGFPSEVVTAEKPGLAA